MKSVFMVLFLLGGLAVYNADAQSCKPCPPGCCATKGSSADAGATLTLLQGSTQAPCTPEQMAACTPEQLANCTPEQLAACTTKKMTKKEMKECQAICQSKVAAAPTGQTVLAGQTATVAPNKAAPPKASKQ